MSYDHFNFVTELNEFDHSKIRVDGDGTFIRHHGLDEDFGGQRIGKSSPNSLPFPSRWGTTF
jgi:hypothetical protein